MSAEQPITAEDLAVTWRTLRALTGNYDILSVGAACLIEACRLVEVEVRVQHGDAVWAATCEH